MFAHSTSFLARPTTSVPSPFAGALRLARAHILRWRTLDAVLRRLQILTESSPRLSDSLKAAYPTIRWRERAGFRNVVVHDYLGIRVERIALIVNRDMPILREQLTAILAATDPIGSG